MNDVKMTIRKDVNINQRGRRGKYCWLYNKIDRELELGETLIIENLESIKDATLIIQAVVRQYGRKNMEIHLRKYNENGINKPTIYLSWREI